MEVKHDSIGQKFFIEVGKDGSESAFLAYTQINNILDVHHVFVPETHRDQGLAEKLALACFNYARENSYKIIPSCLYVKDKFLAGHKELNDLIQTDEF